MTLFIYSPSPLLSNLETYRQESREKATTAPVARLEHSLLVAVGDADPDYANRHAERRATQITPRTECSGCGKLASDWTRGFTSGNMRPNVRGRLPQIRRTRRKPAGIDPAGRARRASTL